MKCPKCQTKVSELDKKCPSCGLDFERFKPESEDITKTRGLAFINVIQLISCIVMAVKSWGEGANFTGFIFLICGIIAFYFIKGFADIIDLLDNINTKLEK